MRQSIPRYLRIYDELKNDILNNKYAGDLLFPTEAELMEAYQVSRTTIRNALKLLHEEGLIESRRGLGTVVTTPASPDFVQAEHVTEVAGAFFYFDLDQPGEEKVTEPIVDTVPADESVAKALELSPGSNVYRIRWLQSVSGITYRYMTNYLPMHLTPDLENRIQHLFPLYRFLKDEYGLEFSHAKDDVIPITASFIEARFLEVEIGKPLFQLNHTAYTENAPLEYSVTVINPDVYKLVLDIRPNSLYTSAHQKKGKSQS